MDGKGNRLINIFGPNETPEQKQQKEAERKRLHDERVKREGEVKALFDEYDKVKGVKRYYPRIKKFPNFRAYFFYVISVNGEAACRNI